MDPDGELEKEAKYEMKADEKVRFFFSSLCERASSLSFRPSCSPALMHLSHFLRFVSGRSCARCVAACLINKMHAV